MELQGGVNRRPAEASVFVCLVAPQASPGSACGVTHNRRPSEAFGMVVVGGEVALLYATVRPSRALVVWIVAGVCARPCFRFAVRLFNPCIDSRILYRFALYFN